MEKTITFIILLFSPFFALADISFEYKELISQHITTYSIKGSLLKLTESGQNRINIYNHNKKNFISYGVNSNKYSIINNNIIKQRALEFNAIRLKKLAAVEIQMAEKLKTMTSAEQEIAQTLINILKYPESYGEHLRLKIKPTNQSKRINHIQCKVYQLFKDSLHLQDICLAKQASIQINSQQYQTLRGFYAFNYALQTRLMLALGDTNFHLIDYDEHKMPGIIMEIIDYEHSKITQHLRLVSISTAKLDDSDFSTGQNNHLEHLNDIKSQ